MELIRRHLAAQPSGYAAYLSLQRALMRRHIAQGGTAEDFCNRLSRVYRARYGEIALIGSSAQAPRCRSRGAAVGGACGCVRGSEVLRQAA